MGIIEDKVRDAKAWWKSNTAVGLVFLILPSILKLIVPGFEGNIEEATNVVLNQGGEIASQLDVIIATVIQAVGLIKVALGIRKAAGGERLTIK